MTPESSLYSTCFVVMMMKFFCPVLPHWEAFPRCWLLINKAMACRGLVSSIMHV